MARRREARSSCRAVAELDSGRCMAGDESELRNETESGGVFWGVEAVEESERLGERFGVPRAEPG